MTIKVDPDWWKKIFDDIYLVTDARSVCDEEITQREVDVICKIIPIEPEQKILDLCGGHGRHSIELYSRGYRNCTLLDYSKTLLHHAKEAVIRQIDPDLRAFQNVNTPEQLAQAQHENETRGSS